MSIIETFKSDEYIDGRTKQSFKDQTDINKLLARAARGDSISHLAKHGAIYGDFTDIDDLLTAQSRLAKGQQIFNELPAEIKREFHQNAGDFFKYVNDPRNSERLPELLPALAERGNQLPSIKRTPEVMAASENASVDNTGATVDNPPTTHPQNPT